MMTLPTFRRRHKPLPPADVWQQLRRDAFARSGGRCQCSDCGRHKGQCTGRLHEGPGGFACDHVIPRNPADPRVPRGPDVPVNLRAVCVACNTAKSNRITTLPEGKIRRRLVTLFIALRLANKKVGLITTPREAIRAPHMITYRWKLAVGDAKLPAGIAEEVQAGLAEVGYKTRVRVYAHAGVLYAEVPIANPPPVPLVNMPRRGLGVDAEGNAVEVDLRRSPGVMVAGQTGSGKSIVVQTLVYQVVRAGGRLIIIDPKYRAGGAALRPFRNLAALECAIANSDEDIDAALALAVRIMDEREPGGDHPLLAVVIDELQELAPEGRRTAERIAKLGREVNIQLIATTQHPTKEVVTNALKNQLTWWIAGRVQNASASVLVIGESGAQSLREPGDMLMLHNGDVTRIRAAIGTPADFARLPQADRPPQPAPREDKREDKRYARADRDIHIATAVELAKNGTRPTGYKLNQLIGGNNQRNHEIAAEVRAAFGMG